MSQNAPSGWYPQQDGTERWWDGEVWTAHTRPVPPPPTRPLESPYAGAHAPSPYAPAPQAGIQHGYHPPVGPYAGWSPVPTGYPVAPKNPAISLLASFFIPGLGTMVNGDVGKGVGILVGYVLCIFTFFLIVPLLIAVGLWVWGMVDAYQGAQTWNRRHGILS